MHDTATRQFFDGICEDACAVADIASFRRRLLVRIGRIVDWDMALVLPSGPLGDDCSRGAVGLELEPRLFEWYLKNRRRYYPSMRPLVRALRSHRVIDAFAVLGASLRDLPVYREFVGPSGTSAQLHALLDFRGEASGALSLKRREGSRCFRARDLERVRAVLAAAGAVDAALIARCASKADARIDPLLLTVRERDVFSLVRAGFQNKEIAAMLGTAADTVRKQTIAIYGKLGVGGRGELLAIYATDARSEPDSRPRESD